MKNRIEVIKPKTEGKIANQINFGCSKKIGGTVITETDLNFAKSILRLANVHKKSFRKIILKS